MLPYQGRNGMKEEYFLTLTPWQTDSIARKMPNTTFTLGRTRIPVATAETVEAWNE